MNSLKQFRPDLIVLLMTFSGAKLTAHLTEDIGLESSIIRLSQTSISYILAAILTKRIYDDLSLLTIDYKKDIN